MRSLRILVYGQFQECGEFQRVAEHAEWRAGVSGVFHDEAELLFALQTDGADAVVLWNARCPDERLIDSMLCMDKDLRLICGRPMQARVYKSRQWREGPTAWDALLVFDPMEEAQMAEQMGAKQLLSELRSEQRPSRLFEKLPVEIQMHCHRVARLADQMIRRAAVSEVFEEEKDWSLRQEAIRYFYGATLFHDIGKAFLPKQLLTKRDPLTRAERALMALHPRIAEKVLADEAPLVIDEGMSGMALRKYMLISVATEHHEQMDGTGLPYGFTGDECTLWSRICAVADSFDHQLRESGGQIDRALIALERQQGLDVDCVRLLQECAA
ncbi:MAG: HD domain-containing phosphohydrolase [Clostridia bacterium]|nr:HD domain-containing phosphohydrolase [Clostridia bacterium]